MSEAVKIEREADFWRVRIANPRRMNALSWAVVEGLIRAASEAAEQPSLRAVILCSEGAQAFCAGADLKERAEMSPAEVEHFLRRLRIMMKKIESSPKVWIAAISGVALGGGLELALCADLRLAQRGARFGLPEVRLGIIPGAGGTQRLPRLIGPSAAKALILTGETISAERALELGLIHELFEEVEEGAEAWAARLSRCAPISLTQAKRAIDGGLNLPLEAALTHERNCYAQTLSTEDRLEGLRAFAEKRAPLFKGK